MITAISVFLSAIIILCVLAGGAGVIAGIVEFIKKERQRP